MGENEEIVRQLRDAAAAAVDVLLTDYNPDNMTPAASAAISQAIQAIARAEDVLREG